MFFPHIADSVRRDPCVLSDEAVTALSLSARSVLCRNVCRFSGSMNKFVLYSSQAELLSLVQLMAGGVAAPQSATDVVSVVSGCFRNGIAKHMAGFHDQLPLRATEIS